MDIVNAIKDKASIEDVISQYIDLKKAWTNLKWLCPWHQEKSPSFIVSPDKQMCWCFGCQKWWDVIKFIELTESLDFVEAAKLLAEKYQIPFELNKDKSNKDHSLLEILTDTTLFYQSALKYNPSANEYLSKRWISNQIIKDFGIWFAPNSVSELYTHLTKKNYSKSSILKIWNISTSSFDWSSIYDRFAWRVIIPINNIHGQTIWFWWRLLNWDGAKYINSPETEVYNKSSTIFGLDKAKDSIKQKNSCIIVEGYFDVISCHKIWITNTVAVSWTALTSSHIRILKRYTSNLHFCFDQDSAWIQACIRAIEMAQEYDVLIKIIIVPNGKDPDECINHQAEDFTKAIDKPISVIEFIFNNIKAKYNLGLLEEKKIAQKEIFEFLLKINSAMERQDYLRKLAFMLTTSEKNIIEDFDNFTKKHWRSKTNEWQLNAKNIVSPEEYLIWLYFWYNFTRQEIINKLIFTILDKDYYLFPIFANIKNWINDIDPLLQDKVNSIILFARKENDINSDEKILQETIKTIKRINLSNIKKQEQRLINAIKTWDKDSTILLDKYQEMEKLKSKVQSF